VLAQQPVSLAIRDAEQDKHIFIKTSMVGELVDLKMFTSLRRAANAEQQTQSNKRRVTNA